MKKERDFWVFTLKLYKGGYLLTIRGVWLSIIIMISYHSEPHFWKAFIAGVCFTFPWFLNPFVWLDKFIKNKFGKIKEVIKDNTPYICTMTDEQVYKYNMKYGNNRICKCGHTYDRHFDSYEDVEPVGCKCCSCNIFEEK